MWGSYTPPPRIPEPRSSIRRRERTKFMRTFVIAWRGCGRIWTGDDYDGVVEKAGNLFDEIEEANK